MAIMPLWVAGVVLSTASQMVGSFGKILLRWMAVDKQRRADAVEPPPSKMIHLLCTLLSIVCVCILNPVFGLWAYCYASQSTLAPLSVLSLVWNATLARLIVSERLTRTDTYAYILIMSGVVLATQSASHVHTDYALPDLVRLYASLPFFMFATIQVAFLSACYCIIRRPTELHSSDPTSYQDLELSESRPNPCDKAPLPQADTPANLAPALPSASPVSPALKLLAYGGMAGTVGGDQWLSKSTAVLIEDELQGARGHRHIAFYAIILATIVVSCGALLILKQGLQHYNTLQLVPIFQSFFVISNVASSMCYFQEYRLYTIQTAANYGVALLLIFAGMFVLAPMDTRMQQPRLMKRQLQGESRQRPSPHQQQLLPH